VIVARGMSDGIGHAFHTALWWQFGMAVAVLLGALGLWWSRSAATRPARSNPLSTGRPDHG